MAAGASNGVVGLSWRVVLSVAAVVGLVLVGNAVVDYLTDALAIEIRPSNEDLVHRVVLATAAGYAVLLAVPFVPGIEIGLALIGVLGPKIVPLVYACTVVGLTTSFLVGRLVPLHRLAAVLDDLGLARASRLLRSVAPLDRPARLALLVQSAPPSAIPALLRHRYLALALVLNLPGNFLIGGGGGISLVAGISGLYSPLGFVATVAAATAPVPIAVMVLGTQVLGM